MGSGPSKTNITYTDIYGYEHTTTRKYTKFPYDMCLNVSS